MSPEPTSQRDAPRLAMKVGSFVLASLASIAVLFASFLSVTGEATSQDSASEPLPVNEAAPERLNTESLLARVNRVTVLRFETDMPVQEVRVVVNGKTVGSESFVGARNGIDFAIVKMGKNITIEMEVPNVGGRFLTAEYSQQLRAEVSETEYFGPGKRLRLAGWTRVYGITQAERDGRRLYSLSVEVR
jgi:hypothetical protein